jgi:ketosteroid isomerase-like protein
VSACPTPSFSGRDTGRAMAEEPTTPDLAQLMSAQLEAANRGDLDGFMSVFTADAVYDASRDGLGVYEGSLAIRGLIGGWWGAFEDFRLTPEQFLDLGNGMAFAVLRHEGRPTGSTGYVDTRQAHVAVSAEGFVTTMIVYPDPAEARAAAERLAQERG